MRQDLPFLSLNKYLKNIFEERVQKIPLDAGLTCPNRDGTKGTKGCIYCDPYGSGTGRSRNGATIMEQMVQGVRWARKRYKAKKYIAYFQSYSNTYASPDKLRKLYSDALISSDVVGLFIGTRPDCIDDAVLDVIEECGKGRLITIELGLQSAHNHTLQSINRGHSVEDFVKAVESIKKRDLNVCAHVIFGLPGESPEEMLATIQLLSSLNIDGIKFHQLYVVHNTQLYEEYKKNKISLLTLDEYCSLVAKAISMLPERTVIHRLQGDPPRDHLVAPKWCLEKNKIRQRIIKILNTHFKEHHGQKNQH